MRKIHPKERPKPSQASSYIIRIIFPSRIESAHITGIVSLLIGVLLVIFGLRIALKTDYRGYDPNDPNQPRVKF
jgi:hypothetical protein